MSKKITPLILTTAKHVLTTSKLEEPEEISNQEFEYFELGAFHPVSKDSSGQGESPMKPTYYDRRDPLLGSFLVEETE